ncbi:hypothetical protein RJ640_003434 [Escallonia rubra]|uniref:Uncharacterized protein n=1 Tax=Escallonia rubra TaxID=112253 RepID=A0AA88U8K3_9ASTE|nr:hypothetical protein RJ640_003434 [Escallonia rubra]
MAVAESRVYYRSKSPPSSLVSRRHHHQLSSMDCSESKDSASPVNAYELLFTVIRMIPKSHYVLGFISVTIVFFYNFLEFHFFEDVVLGFRGSPVSLTFNSGSEIYQGVASKCRILHGSIQQVVSDSGVWDPWLRHYPEILVCAQSGVVKLVPGNTMAFKSSYSNYIFEFLWEASFVQLQKYIKHLAFDMAKHGWNVVVSNHRGLGGISVTTDCFYNAGWTQDTRDVIKYLHHEYPNAPLFAIGLSIGANILEPLASGYEKGVHSHLDIHSRMGRSAFYSEVENVLTTQEALAMQMVKYFHFREIRGLAFLMSERKISEKIEEGGKSQEKFLQKEGREKRWKLWQLDVKNGFPYAEFDQEIKMEQPLRFKFTMFPDHRPRKRHLGAEKRILRYLNRRLTHWLLYKKDVPFTFSGLTDADWPAILYFSVLEEVLEEEVDLIVVDFNEQLADISKVKYLGEDGDNVPVAGAAAVCSPWDLLEKGSKIVQGLYRLYGATVGVAVGSGEGAEALHATRLELALEGGARGPGELALAGGLAALPVALVHASVAQRYLPDS